KDRQEFREVVVYGRERRSNLCDHDSVGTWDKLRRRTPVTSAAKIDASRPEGGAFEVKRSKRLGHMGDGKSARAESIAAHKRLALGTIDLDLMASWPVRSAGPALCQCRPLGRCFDVVDDFLKLATKVGVNPRNQLMPHQRVDRHAEGDEH